ncbi:hypothetical protein OUZ56_012208 [Daphnia magna]|uniref:Uncharacterized protein n=1 Tax=Daphnia magna TaxID=35525 RepID=A0ABQ9Z2J2_9CRUS|nr:hypothetical protein OUZ56_012208 [Daphnia magna]
MPLYPNFLLMTYSGRISRQAQEKKFRRLDANFCQIRRFYGIEDVEWEEEEDSELGEDENEVTLENAPESQDPLPSVTETLKKVPPVQPVEVTDPPVGRESCPPRWHDDYVRLLPLLSLICKCQPIFDSFHFSFCIFCFSISFFFSSLFSPPI